MTHTFDESRFRSLWRNADEALQLEQRVRVLLESRDVSSFDGLGHLLDAVLPDDPARIAQIAGVLRLPSEHLARLRSSELDPLGLPLEPMALLGRVIGLTPEAVAGLMQRDHARFAPAARGVTARSARAEESEAVLARLREIWARFASDEATEL